MPETRHGAWQLLALRYSSNYGMSHLFEPTMTGSSSFPSDRWRGPTIKQEQKSLSQPKPCRVVLIVCSGAAGIAYLNAAITNCLHRDRLDLLWTFREWFVFRGLLGERNMGRDREVKNEKTVQCKASRLDPLCWREPCPAGVTQAPG